MQAQSYPVNRRTATRIKKILGPHFDIVVTEGHHRRTARARLLDYTDAGICIQCLEAISPGSTLRYQNEANTEERHARVVWCQKSPNGEYRVGAALETPFTNTSVDEGEHDESGPDFYELLQVNPKADLDTIHRVYRLQAQRFHPDNKETGSEPMFKVLVRAYRTLSDPELRAAYDLKLNNIQQKRWKIFDKPVQAVGVEAEKRKRQGMLSLLYMRRIQEPRSPQMSIQDFENLLGVPREHLEFGMWYMREAGLVTRSDNGRLSITVKGVEELERCPDAIGRAHVETREDRLLTN
jgi:hypothetical protein